MHVDGVFDHLLGSVRDELWAEDVKRRPFNRDDGTVDPLSARYTPRYCNYRKTTIYAGSNEIQRNIIAKMTLGL